MTTVAIIVLNWNQPIVTINTVQSILKIKHPHFSYKVFIVDNHSSDDSLKFFKKKFSKNHQIKISQTKTNLGYVGGNNFGIKKTFKNFNYILVINNDVYVDQYFLQKLIDFCQHHKDTYIVGPKIYFAKGFEFHKERYQTNDLGNIIWSAGGKMDWHNIIGSNIGVDQIDRGQFDQISTSIDFLSGCCLLINSKLFKQVGFFDPQYFMYLEDVDFCQRTKKLNYKIAYVPQSKIWHLNAVSTKVGGSFHDYFLTRNRLLFGLRYASFKTKIALIKESLKTLLFSPYPWQKRGVIDFYLGKLNKGSWK